MNYYISVLKKYAVFSGRSRRAEYWYFTLFNIIIGVVLSIISAMFGINANALGLIYMLIILIPGIAVTVRRLHDTNHSGWWIFINLIPLIGPITILVFLTRDSQTGQNKYGPNPKEIATS